MEDAPEILVADLDALCEEIARQRGCIGQIKKKLALEQASLLALENKAIGYLVDLNRKNYQSPYGTISVQDKWYFTLPETEEEKLLFLDYLKEKGLFEKYATVHSTAYNSYLNAELKIAEEEGRAMEFSVPGVPAPKFHRTARFTSKKGALDEE